MCSSGASFKTLSALFSIALLCGAAPSGADARDERHPRLLITPTKVSDLRHACGLPVGTAVTAQRRRAGTRTMEFQALRAHFAQRDDGELLPGELLGAAFLHLVDPDDAFDRRRLALIDRALRQPIDAAADALETVLALDWCWPALEPEARRDFVLALRKWALPLTPADSPLEHRLFAPKLASLAAVLAIDAEDEPSPAWAEVRKRILAAARTYFEETFPTYVRWRGLSPTSPAAGPWEERDTALAVELAGALLERDLWPDYRDSVGRWLEHYVFASFSHPALQHHFIRDDGNLAPLSPAPTWVELLPVTAHLIAARTRDPAAVFVARRVEQQLRGPTADTLALPWQWVPILFETAGLPRCDFGELPAARNLGGAVVFRGRDGPLETGIWIEAGQPFLRRRQHFDAGHFVVYGAGELVIGGGDDVSFEAVPSKGGAQRLGQTSRPFDFEQYFTATIAHNSLLLWDPLRVVRWYGERYEPIGGQRLIEGTCTDFRTSPEATGWQTARQLAYGQRTDMAYLALDLHPAYDPQAASSYTREFVFLHGRVLVVVDRVNTRGSRNEPIWILNLPARPTADAQDLPAQARAAGNDNDAGVWRLDAARSLRWIDREGALRMYPLLPDAKRLRVVGGPAKKLVVSEGAYAGRAYTGGQPDGFERLIRPAERGRPQNAWYRLGRPMLLGPTFGVTPHWGRVEIESADKADAHVFVTVLVVEAADAARHVEVELVQREPMIAIELRDERMQTTLRLPPGADIGGSVEVEPPTAERWELPRAVEADAPLAAD